MWHIDPTEEEKDILFEAWAFCDMEDKSTEFMLDYMQDKAEIELDSVLAFIEDNTSNRTDWYKQNPNWHKKYE